MASFHLANPKKLEFSVFQVFWSSLAFSPFSLFLVHFHASSLQWIRVNWLSWKKCIISISRLWKCHVLPRRRWESNHSWPTWAECHCINLLSPSMANVERQAIKPCPFLIPRDPSSSLDGSEKTWPLLLPSFNWLFLLDFLLLIFVIYHTVSLQW